VGLTLALAAPFVVAFVTLPDLIMSALFQRGAFDAAAAERSGAVLAAYAVGLPAAVLIRSAVASFYARSDTVTPLIASLSAVAINVALKIVLTGPYGVVGLALATAIGIWVNLGLLVLLALRRDWMALSGTLGRTAAAVAVACLLLGAFAWFAPLPLSEWTTGLPAWNSEILLAILGAAGALIYGGVLLAGLKVLGVRLSRR
jgi:putative peptidoglycan lipid II flippase